MNTVAQLIDRYIADMNGTREQAPLKPLGASHLYSLNMLKRSELGQLDATKLTKHDIKAHCIQRRKTVCPATVNQDICYLGGVLKYAPAAWEDCEDVSAAAIEAARPLLVKYALIGKSAPRKRVPTGDEEARLLELLFEEDKHSCMKVAEVMAFALVSTRRLSEICRIKHGDIDWNHIDSEGNPAPMYMVRDLKHPTKKSGNHKWFPLLDPLPEIIRRQPRMSPDNPEERVFPFNHKSVGQRYTRAKKKLGIENLRFHDNRREAITRWLKIGLSPHQVKLISGHETTHILERVYDASKPEGLHGSVADLMRAKLPSVAAQL